MRSLNTSAIVVRQSGWSAYHHKTLVSMHPMWQRLYSTLLYADCGVLAHRPLPPWVFQLASDGRMESEVNMRIGDASQDFKVLARLWNHSCISNRFAGVASTLASKIEFITRHEDFRVRVELAHEPAHHHDFAKSGIGIIGVAQVDLIEQDYVCKFKLVNEQLVERRRRFFLCALFAVVDVVVCVFTKETLALAGRRVVDTQNM